ncbi:MAG: prolipoprotein diacylglyceryl transferase [Patescibacteria group bacterium]
MINWLHNFEPRAILFAFGPLQIHWYGLFMVIAILCALFLGLKLAKYYHIDSDKLFDLAFWLIIFGLIGARIYDDLLQLPYYLAHPLDSIKIWQGGLAIHGAIIAGLITIYFFARRHKLSLLALISVLLPGLALGQAIGRWGNYFNQEIFGLPTSLPWGIPIALINRPYAYLSSTYFQPTFLYESLGCFLIFLILLGANIYLIKKNKLSDFYSVWLIAFYMVSYSILRFSLEFIRLDEAPSFLGLRWPQLMSLIIIIASVLLLIFNPHAKTKNN